MRSSSSRPAVIALCLPLLLTTFALPAMADVTLGADARAAAMGGAGLASGDSPASSNLNPASLADTGVRFNVQWPTITAGMEGASYSDAFKLIGNPSLSPSRALDYAVTLGKQDTAIDAAATAGIMLPRMDLQARANIRTEINPNESFKAWASAGGNGVPAADARADVYAAGVATLPSLGVGFHLPVREDTVGRFSVGVRLKPTTTYYSHYVVDSDAVAAGAPQLAPEMGGEDYVKQSSFCADLGVTFTPAKMPYARFGVVVNNLIEPKAISLTNTPGSLLEKQLAPRSVSAGAAFVGDYATLAADLVDVTSAYGDPQLRLGIEVRTKSGLLALRGGYNSDTGFTTGFGIGNFGVAFSKEAPVMLSQQITF